MMWVDAVDCGSVNKLPWFGRWCNLGSVDRRIVNVVVQVSVYLCCLMLLLLLLLVVDEFGL